MTISERMLRKWRQEALQSQSGIPQEVDMHEGDGKVLRRLERIILLNERVLRMTQELLDQHLIRKS